MIRPRYALRRSGFGLDCRRTYTMMGTTCSTTSNEARMGGCTGCPALKSSAKTAASATPQKPTSSDSFGAASPLHRILKNHRKHSKRQLRSAKHNVRSSFGCRFHVKCRESAKSANARMTAATISFRVTATVASGGLSRLGPGSRAQQGRRTTNNM